MPVFFRKIALFFLLSGTAAAFFFGCYSAPFRAALYEPGIYEGSSRGYRGPITVRLLISASGIEDIEILDHREDDAVGGAAMEELKEQILELGLSTEDIDLDAVSGATASRKGFLDALDDALSKARH